MGQLTSTWRRQGGLTPSSGEYTVFNTVIFMGLLAQFGPGDGDQPVREHPPPPRRATATNVLSGIGDSVSWAIAHDPIVLAIHAGRPQEP